jgi:PAS domain-containing protein
MRYLIGFGLMGLAVVALLLFISGSPLVTPIQAAIACSSDEQFGQVEGGRSCDSFGRNCGTAFAYVCTNAEGSARDVTVPVFGISAAAFIIPFIAGLFILIFGLYSRRPMVTATDWLGQPTQIQSSVHQEVAPGQFVLRQVGPTRVQNSTLVTMDGKQVDPTTLSPEINTKIQQAMAMLGTTLDSMPMATEQTDLAAQIEQLQEARDKGLISGEEYERLRKAILDKLT